MRRSHAETIELIAARTADYVNGDMSEDVLAASFKALHVSPDDVKYYVWRAQLQKLKAVGAIMTPKEQAR